MSTTVLRDGSVYSPADPYATAMVIQDGMVQWVGSDAGAESILDDSMQVEELEGDLLAPAFAAAGIRVHPEDDLQDTVQKYRAAGYGALTFMLTPEALQQHHQHLTSLQDAAIYLEIEHLHQIPDHLSVQGILLDPQGILENETGMSLLDEAQARGLKAALRADSSARIDAALQIALKMDSLQRMKLALRLDGVTDLTESHITQLSSMNVALGFTSGPALQKSALKAAITAGITSMLGSNPTQDSQLLGWELALSMVSAGESDHQLSARATFAAMTKSCFRGMGHRNPLMGQLVPQAPATFCRWRADQLMVQTPDSRVAAWSTDPRARIPLLPVLEAGNLPTLISLHHA
ncbi:hypothetical protein VVR12_02720 [Rothia sp. LK2588]|uniref:hypothetical protein n=1 Tax=Rothia sp. LK2588 TaxID=3114369 RepID=UPI0034CE0603